MSAIGRNIPSKNAFPPIFWNLCAGKWCYVNKIPGIVLIYGYLYNIYASGISKMDGITKKMRAYWNSTDLVNIEKREYKIEDKDKWDEDKKDKDIYDKEITDKEIEDKEIENS